MPYGMLPEVEVTIDGQLKLQPAFPVVIVAPPKQALLRLPTSVELLEYLSAQRSTMTDLGRGKTKYADIPNPKADRKLFDAIRIDKTGEEFDDAEALYAIGLITRLRISDCTRDGQNYVVGLDTLFGSTVHTVRMPWRKEMVEYQRAVDDPVSLPHGVEQHRFPPEVPVKLYDKIVQSATGYSDGDNAVPPHHKRAVINSVMEAMSLLDPGFDPNS